jgi:hypothetical protein
MSNSVARLIDDFNDISNKTCLITYENFKENDLKTRPIVKLLCGHCFYFENILNSYKITNKHGQNFVHMRLCPYCMQKGGYLPRLTSERLANIYLDEMNVPKCYATIKSGKNKGFRCGCNVKNILLYKFIEEEKESTNSDGSSEITKSKKKVYYCNRHKKQAQPITK